MSGPAPTLCRTCAKPRDELGRCFRCYTWLCACGGVSGSAIRSLCNMCDMRPEAPEEPAVTTVYGQPAVLVPQPDGSEKPYLIADVEADAEEWRAWEVTGPDGQKYRVSEYPDGLVRCACPAARWNRHGAGRWCEIGAGKKVCKHGLSVFEQVIQGATA